MLDGMRKASQGWLGRIVVTILFGFLILSFAIWGIGDIFRNFGTQTVATVGKTEIPSEALRQAYQTQLQQMQRQARRPVTNDMARAMGVDARALAKLIGDAALDETTRSLGLAISDQDVAKMILTDPTFAGPDGKFNQFRFSEILRDNGFNERSFAQEQRRVYLRHELVEALAGNISVPQAVIAAIHRYRAETRSVDYFELPATAAGDIGKPDEAALQAFYDARQASFRAPEYRGFASLALSPSSVADPSKVTDADAQGQYERQRARYSTAESREVEKALFNDEKTAQEASEKIRGGATLEAAAEELKSSVVSLGDNPKSAMFDKTIADIAFMIPEGLVSPPVKEQFGYSLVRVKKITPEVVKPFAEVADEIKKDIATERGKKTVADLRDKIEDERTSGKALAEAARTAGVTAMVVEASDQNGRDKNGKEIEGLPERETLLRSVFASDVGVDNETLNTRDNGYVWFEVTNVEKARDRPLAEVRDKVEAAWREDEIARRLQAKAAELVKRIDAGEKLEDIAKAEGGLEVKNVNDATRVEASKLPAGVSARVFAVPIGKAGSAEAPDNARVVFKVLDSSTPVLDPESDANKGVESQLKTSVGEDILAQYLAKLQTDLGVRINAQAARVATGGSADQN